MHTLILYMNQSVQIPAEVFSTKTKNSTGKKTLATMVRQTPTDKNKLID